MKMKEILTELRTNHKLKYLKFRNYNYVHVTQGNLDKFVLVSRFIMQCFYGLSDLEVNHKNGNTDDNRIQNLEYVTRRQNCLHRERIIKTGNSRPVMCLDTGVIYSSAKQASTMTGIWQGNISSCARGRYQTAGGLRWKYIERGQE